MKYDINGYIKILNDPNHTTDWAGWKNWYTAYSKSKLAGLNSAEHKANEQYSTFTTQARDQLTQAVQQVKSAVDKNALSRGISWSTIPGSVIGSETNRMDDQYQKQDESAKSGLEQTVAGIRASRRSINKLTAKSADVQAYFATTERAPDIDAEKATAAISATDIESMKKAGVPTSVTEAAQQALNSLNNQIKTNENEYGDRNIDNYNTAFAKWMKGDYGVDISKIDTKSKADTLENRNYWSLKKKFNSLVDSMEYNRNKVTNVGQAKENYDTYTQLSTMVPAQILNYVFPNKPGSTNLDLLSEVQKSKFKTDVGVTDYINTTATAAKKYQSDIETSYSDLMNTGHVDYANIKIPNIDWEKAGYQYNTDDAKDQKRKEMGWPPESFLSQYTNSAEDQKRLRNGQLPKALEDKYKPENVDEVTGFNGVFTGGQVDEKTAAQRKVISTEIKKLLDGGDTKIALDIINKDRAEYTRAGYNVDALINGINTHYSTQDGPGIQLATFKNDVMNMAAQNGIHSKQDIINLYNNDIKNGQYRALSSLSTDSWMPDLINNAISDQNQKYGGSSNTSKIFGQIKGWFEETPFEKQLRETGKAPDWQNIGSPDQTNTVLSYTPSSGRVAIYEGEDNKFHAVKEWKDGTNTEVGGPYDTMEAAQGDVNAHWDKIANGPAFGQVVTSGLQEGTTSTRSAFVRTGADLAYLMERLTDDEIDPQEFMADIQLNYNDYAGKTVDYIKTALNPDELFSSGEMTDMEAGLVSTAAQNVKAYLDAGYDLADLKIDRYYTVSVASEKATSEEQTRNLIGIMSALDIVPPSVALQSQSEDLTALAQQHAQDRKTDNEFLRTVGDVVSSVPSLAGGVVASAFTPIGSAAYWAALGYGEGANTAQQMGASYDQQLLFGGGDAIVSGLMGGVELPRAMTAPITKLFEKGLMKQGLEAISKTGLKAFARMAELPAAMEIQNITLNAMQKGIFKPDMPWLGKGGVVDPEQMFEVAKQGVILSLGLKLVGMGGEAGKYILDEVEHEKVPDMGEAIRINKEVDAPTNRQAAEFAKNIDESTKIKTDESTPEYKDSILSSKEEKAVTATGAKLEKSFEINENVQRVSSMNAKGMADAVLSTGHTLVQGDLVELTVVKGKAIEIRLFEGIPFGTETRVMKYEGVGHDGKNPSFVKATNVDLAAAGKFRSGAAGEVAVEGEYFAKDSFNKNIADPLRDIYGPGIKSHPKEWKSICDDVRMKLGKIRIVSESTMAYSPLSKGQPGEVIINENASYSALMHEYQHFLDDMADGWLGPEVLYDYKVRIMREEKAYLVEIRNAESAGLGDAANQLWDNYIQERNRILNNYGPIPKGGN